MGGSGAWEFCCRGGCEKLINSWTLESQMNFWGSYGSMSRGFTINFFWRVGSAFFYCLFERAFPGAPKKVYFVGGPLESQKVMVNVRKCRKTFWDSNVTGNFFKFFLRPDMDSAHVNALYGPFLNTKYLNFFPDLIPKGVPLLGDFRDFLNRHNFFCYFRIWIGFSL